MEFEQSNWKVKENKETISKLLFHLNMNKMVKSATIMCENVMCRISHLIWCGYVEGYMRFVSRQMINVLLNIFSTSTPDSHNPALTLFHKSLSQKWNGHAPNTNTQKLMMKTGKKITKMFENSWNSLEHFFSSMKRCFRFGRIFRDVKTWNWRNLK